MKTLLLFICILLVPRFIHAQQTQTLEQQEQFKIEMEQFKGEMLSQMKSLQDSLSKMKGMLDELKQSMPGVWSFGWETPESDSNFFYLSMPEFPNEFNYEFQMPPIPVLPEVPLFEVPDVPQYRWEYKLKIPDVPQPPRDLYYYEFPDKKNHKWMEMLPFYHLFQKTSINQSIINVQS